MAPPAATVRATPVLVRLNVRVLTGVLVPAAGAAPVLGRVLEALVPELLVPVDPVDPVDAVEGVLPSLPAAVALPVPLAPAALSVPEAAGWLPEDAPLLEVGAADAVPDALCDEPAVLELLEEGTPDPGTELGELVVAGGRIGAGEGALAAGGDEDAPDPAVPAGPVWFEFEPRFVGMNAR